MSAKKRFVIDSTNIVEFVTQIFQMVENTYVRRSEYKPKVSDLEERIAILEGTSNYQFAYDSEGTGELTLTTKDGDTPNLSFSGQDLILTEEDDEQSALENFKFSQTEDGELKLTIGLTA